MKPLYDENDNLVAFYIPEEQMDETHRKVTQKWFEENMFQNKCEKSNNGFANAKLNENSKYIIKDYVIEINQ